MPDCLMWISATSNSGYWMISRASRTPDVGRAVYPSLVSRLRSESRTNSSSSSIRLLPFVLTGDVGSATLLTIASSRNFIQDLRLAAQRHRYPEFCAFAGLGLNRDFSGMLLDDAEGDGEPQPGSELVLFGGKEG